jgi:hypothetical protein
VLISNDDLVGLEDELRVTIRRALWCDRGVETITTGQWERAG